MVSKQFGYIQFDNYLSLSKALDMHNTKLWKGYLFRKIRVLPCNKQDSIHKNMDKNKKHIKSILNSKLTKMKQTNGKVIELNGNKINDVKTKTQRGKDINGKKLRWRDDPKKMFKIKNKQKYNIDPKMKESILNDIKIKKNKILKEQRLKVNEIKRQKWLEGHRLNDPYFEPKNFKKKGKYKKESNNNRDNDDIKLNIDNESDDPYDENDEELGSEYDTASENEDYEPRQWRR